MKKKIVSILLAALMLLAVIPVFSAAVSAEDGGITVSDWTASEITLYTTSDFVEFRRRISAEENNGFRGQTIKLGADIDLTGVKTGTNNTLPVGGCFYGIFDGQFHKLKNVPHKVTWGSSGILFGDIVEVRDKEKYPEPVTVRNLAIVELDSTLCYNGNYSGLLFCSVWDDLTIENVYISGSIDGLTGSSPQAVFAVEVKGNDDRESTLNISNCVFDGTVVNGQNCASAIFVGAVLKTKVGRQMNVKVNITNCLSTSDKPFIGSYEVEELKAKCTVTNTLQYTDSGVKADVGEGFAAQNYLDDNGMTGWTALNTGYPVPSTLLPFLAETVNAVTPDANASTKYYGYQSNGEGTAARFVGLVTGAPEDFGTVGYEIVAVSPTAKLQTISDEMTCVYNSVMAEGTSKTAAELGGDYIFVTSVGGIRPDSGVVTFAVKTFSTDNGGTKTYTDIKIVSIDTSVAG